MYSTLQLGCQHMGKFITMETDISFSNVKPTSLMVKRPRYTLVLHLYSVKSFPLKISGSVTANMISSSCFQTGLQTVVAPRGMPPPPSPSPCFPNLFWYLKIKTNRFYKKGKNVCNVIDSFLLTCLEIAIFFRCTSRAFVTTSWHKYDSVFFLNDILKNGIVPRPHTIPLLIRSLPSQSPT